MSEIPRAFYGRHGRLSSPEFRRSLRPKGDIDLRGLFSLDPAMPAGYGTTPLMVHIASRGTPEQFGKIHRTVVSASPSYFNLSRAIQMKSQVRNGCAETRAAA
jgi:hypothetical protein